MREMRDEWSLLKHNNSININEKVCIGGYIYTKVSSNYYENNACSIKLFPEHQGGPVKIFKSGVKKGCIRNQFGQILKSGF